MRVELEIMLKSYDYLRQEISNAVSWQNRVFTATVVIISILLGLGLTLGLGIEEVSKLSVIAIPPAIVAFIAFWLIEQSRMMRAGDYLQLLEDEINLEAGGAYILWENWLRDDMAGIIHKIHHTSQYLGVFGLLYTIGAISLWQLWKNPTRYDFPLWALWLYIIMLFIMLVLVILAVRHRPRKRSEFEEWEMKYLRKLLK